MNTPSALFASPTESSANAPHAAPRQRLAHAALALALPLLALAGTAAQAAPQDATLSRVEISSARVVSTPRTDVRAVCPKVDEDLHRALAPLVYQLKEEGVTTVKFRLLDRQVMHTSAVGGPQAYRMPLRRAVNALQCQGEPQVDQAYVMEVSFRQDASGRTHARVVQLRPLDAAEGIQLATAASTR